MSQELIVTIALVVGCLTEGKSSLSKKFPSGEWEDGNVDIDLNALGMLVAPHLDDENIVVPGTFGDERFVREGRKK